MAYEIRTTISPKGLLIIGAGTEIKSLLEGADAFEIRRASIRITDQGVAIITDAAPRKVMPEVMAVIERASTQTAAKADPTPARRIVVRGSTTEEEMRQSYSGFTGFGRSWRLRGEDACRHGLSPDLDGEVVKYAYFS